MPDKLVVDVGEETFAEFDTRTGEDERLERDVGQMDFLLKAGGGFDLNQIPRTAGNRHENVRAGVAAMENECGFIQRPARLDRLLGCGDDFVGSDDSGRYDDAAGEKLLCQFADFRALVKHGLRCLVGRGNLILGVVAKPEELGTLPPHEEGGLGETWLVRWE